MFKATNDYFFVRLQSIFEGLIVIKNKHAFTVVKGEEIYVHDMITILMGNRLKD